MSEWRRGEADILDLINQSCARMTVPQRRLWVSITIDPVEWIFRPHSSPPSTVWVVAVFGTRAVWYDDYYGEMHDGFKLSEHVRFSEVGSGATGDGSLETTLTIILQNLNGLTYGDPPTPPALP